MNEEELNKLIEELAKDYARSVMNIEWDMQAEDTRDGVRGAVEKLLSALVGNRRASDMVADAYTACMPHHPFHRNRMAFAMKSLRTKREQERLMSELQASGQDYEKSP